MLLLIPIAFLSGILTVFSPCVLPILPIILASGIDGNTKRIKGVVAGLVVSFTIASLLLATIVRLLGIPADTIRVVAVGLLVLFGLGLVFPHIWEKIQTFIEKYWKFTPKQNKNSGFFGGFLTGVSLGIVWTPCIGPVVAAVATLAAVSSFSITAVLIAFAYALGTGLPLYFIAKGGSKVSLRLAFVKTENQKIRQIFGLIILATALFIWSGADRKLQTWTLDNLPESWTNITTTFESRLDIDSQLQQLKNAPELQSEPADEKEIIIENIPLQSDFAGAKVSELELIQGCPRKDCIPSIDDPQFETAETADQWLNPSDRVFAINLKGVTRAYPQRIMNWHEIVNDEVDGFPIAITFCPLCGSAVGFEREIDGVISELGVSGKLHNSDLVMYDRYEGNLWQQITGEAIVGPAARRNEILKKIPVITVEWQKWKAEHPDTQVLSRQTGFTRDYGLYPYGTYEQDDTLFFGVEGLDSSLQVKTVVYGIDLGISSKAYPETVFDETPVILDSLGETSIRLERQDNGEIAVLNLETKEEIVPVRLFWFAWAAFHPDTQLYEK